MQLKISSIKFSLLALFLTIKTVTSLQCFECKSDPGCKNNKDCMESCNKAQKVTVCDESMDHVCINVSYSYLKDGEMKYEYKRGCSFYVMEIAGFGCETNCNVPRHFNSTDCKVTCCEGDLCNSNNPTVSKLISDEGTPSHDHNNVTPNKLLLAFLLLLAVVLYPRV